MWNLIKCLTILKFIHTVLSKVYTTINSNFDRRPCILPSMIQWPIVPIPLLLYSQEYNIYKKIVCNEGFTIGTVCCCPLAMVLHWIKISYLSDMLVLEHRRSRGRDTKKNNRLRLDQHFGPSQNRIAVCFGKSMDQQEGICMKRCVSRWAIEYFDLTPNYFYLHRTPILQFVNWLSRSSSTMKETRTQLATGKTCSSNLPSAPHSCTTGVGWAGPSDYVWQQCEYTQYLSPEKLFVKSLLLNNSPLQFAGDTARGKRNWKLWREGTILNSSRTELTRAYWPP